MISEILSIFKSILDLKESISRKLCVTKFSLEDASLIHHHSYNYKAQEANRESHSNYFKTNVTVLNNLKYDVTNLECIVSDIKLTEYVYSEIDITDFDNQKENVLYIYAYNNGNDTGGKNYKLEISYIDEENPKETNFLLNTERYTELKGGEIQLIFKLDILKYITKTNLPKGRIHFKLLNENILERQWIFNFIDKKVIRSFGAGAGPQNEISQIFIDLTDEKNISKVHKYVVKKELKKESETSFDIEFLIDRICTISYTIDVLNNYKSIGNQDITVNINMPRYKRYANNRSLGNYIYNNGCKEHLSKLNFEYMRYHSSDSLYTVRDTRKDNNIL